MALTVSGVAGQVTWGYYVTCTVRAWTVTHDGGQWTLVASLASVDTFRVSQRPLVFVARHATGVWRWPVRDVLQLTDGTLAASLGPLES